MSQCDCDLVDDGASPPALRPNAAIALASASRRDSDSRGGMAIASFAADRGDAMVSVRVYVNEIRVRERELVDNDIVLLGSHSFHFKSIH